MYFIKSSLRSYFLRHEGFFVLVGIEYKLWRREKLITVRRKVKNGNREKEKRRERKGKVLESGAQSHLIYDFYVEQQSLIPEAYDSYQIYLFYLLLPEISAPAFYQFILIWKKFLFEQVDFHTSCPRQEL